MLPDSGHIQEMEVEWKNRKRKREGKEGYPPLYTAEQAAKSVELFKSVNYDEIIDAIEKAKSCKGMPTVIICKTVKGKGVSFMENECGWHGKAPNEEEYNIAMAELRAALAEIEEA